MARFEKDLAGLENKKRIDADKAKPFEEFATAIHAELTRLKLPAPAGAPAS